MRTAGLTGLFVVVVSLFGARAEAQAAPVLVVNGQAVQSTPVSSEPVSADQAPPRERRPHVAQSLAIAGGAILGAGWVAGIIIGLFGGYHDTTCWIGPCSTPPTSWDPAWDDFRGTSLIPIVGPWVQLAVKPSSGPDGWPTWLVIDGIIQGAGTILLLVGVGLLGSEEEPPPVAILPMLSPSVAGLEALGRF